ncbi:MAG TPA: MXAN_5187 family protein [Polyangiaceae bacterium]|nr:MXAN_5187 family protein [Polyangiaceae bacterium]
MIASRFWFGVLGLALAFAVLVLELAVSMHDRLGMRMVSEGLLADSRVVSWYLRNEAREDAAQLIRFAANDSVARALASASRATDPSEIDGATRRQLKATLSKIAAEMPKADSFDAIFAVAQSGEVLAHIGFDQAINSPDFELGGYPVVADALHGYVRDDTLMFDRLYRVVARPVEFELGQLPAGAIVGAHVIDDAFAAELAERTSAAVAFYAAGKRLAAGMPSGVDHEGLDQLVTDLPSLDGDQSYKDKGRSEVHELADGMAVVYARLPGEAWQLGAGYAVARQGYKIAGLTGVLSRADSKDKDAVNTLRLVAIALGAIGIGLLLSFWEYNSPLGRFRRQVKALSGGQATRFAAERLRAPFRQLGLDLNLALDRIARAGGGDEAPISIGFEQMFGDATAQPSMSAFGVPPSAPPSAANPVEASPMPGSAQAQPASPPRRPPRAAAQPAAPAPIAPVSIAPDPPLDPAFTASYSGGTVVGLGSFSSGAGGDGGYPNGSNAADTAGAGSGVSTTADEGVNGAREVDPEWTQVYQDFVRIKQDCGEAVEGFTFERFTQTLRKNRDTLMREHGVQHVQFSAYVKQGRAALKAKPVRQ